MSADRRILYEEVERINAERGTNLTVEGILQGPSRKDAKWVLKSIFSALSVGLLAFIAGIMIWMGVTIDGSSGTHAFVLVIGAIALLACFFPLRAEWRMIRDWNREIKAIDEMNRRVDARHTAMDQGRAE